MRVSVWRWASMTPKIIGIPCTAYLPILIWMVRWRWWSFYLAVASILLFAILAKKGITVKVLYRKVMSWVRGARIYARPWWYRNRFQDRD